MGQEKSLQSRHFLNFDDQTFKKKREMDKKLKELLKVFDL